MPYTDYLDNPIAKGDVIVYPTASGSSSAELNTARVVDVVPIYPVDPNDETCRRGFTQEDLDKGRDYGGRDIVGKWVKRADLQSGSGDYLRDDSKAYLLRVVKLNRSKSIWIHSERTVLLKNVDRVVVVSKLKLPAEVQKAAI